MNGLAGLAGGGYQRRIDEREGVYQGELSAQDQLKAQALELERERAEVRSELDQARARLAALETRVRRARARLAAQSHGTTATQAQRAQLDRAESRIVQTRDQLGSIHPGDQSVADLKTRSLALQSELDDIDELVGTVSGKGF